MTWGMRAPGAPGCAPSLAGAGDPCHFSASTSPNAETQRSLTALLAVGDRIYFDLAKAGMSVAPPSRSELLPVHWISPAAKTCAWDAAGSLLMVGSMQKYPGSWSHCRIHESWAAVSRAAGAVAASASVPRVRQAEVEGASARWRQIGCAVLNVPAAFSVAARSAAAPRSAETVSGLTSRVAGRVPVPRGPGRSPPPRSG